MNNFQDKVVVVTGAAGGIGRALADAFVAAGARLVISDIDEEALHRASDELAAAGASVLAVKADVSRPADVAALAEATMERFGAVHVVCNNAGVGQALRPVWDLSLSHWQWVFGVNFYGVVHGMQTFVPILLQQGTEGHIVNVASMAGLISYPLPHMGIYSAAKHAVVSVSETLAADLAMQGSNIKVSVVCPGFVRTRIFEMERHRPEHLVQEHHVNAALEDMWREGIGAGTDARIIADRILEGIRQDHLYILPHREFDDAIRSHAEDLILERNPVVPG